MNLVVTTEEKLIELIDYAVSNAVERVTKIQEAEKEKDKFLTLSGLIDYLPEHPAKQTVYGWVTNRKIPYQKQGKALYFKKSEIDNWLDNARKMNHLKID